MTSDAQRSERPSTWGAAGVGLALLALPVVVWDFFAEPPLVLTVLALVFFGLGALSWLVAAILRAREEQVSAVRLVGRAIAAPFRFLWEFMF